MFAESNDPLPLPLHCCLLFCIHNLAGYEDLKNSNFTTNMDSYALVTYCCSHFAIVPAEGATLLVEPGEILEEYAVFDSSTDDLLGKPTTQHIRITNSFCTPECEESSLLEHKRRLQGAAFTLRCFLQRAGSEYLRLGIDYHRYHPRIRSRLADVDKAALANLQYGIELRPWQEDPFFEPWRTAIAHLEAARSLMKKNSWGQEVLPTVVQEINDCREMVGRIVGQMNELRVGMAKLENRRYAIEISHSSQMDERAERRARAKTAKREQLAALINSAELRAEARSAQSRPPSSSRDPARSWKKDKLLIQGFDVHVWLFARSVKKNWVDRMQTFGTLFKKAAK